MVAIALALAPQASVYASLSDAEFCGVIQSAMEYIETPMAIGTVGRLESMSANCEDRMVVANVTMLEEGTALSAEERNARQSHWTCRSPVLAVVVQRGWRIQHRFTFPSGEQAVTEVGAC
jgi:hypothetical protein